MALSLSLPARVAAYNHAFSKWPGSWLWIPPTAERAARSDRFQGIWAIGNDYRNKTRYYGAYPNGYLDRLAALYPDATPEKTLHVFSGSLPAGPYTRLDLRVDLKPDVVGSVYDVSRIFGDRRFDLVIADPPYSDADAARYGTPMIDRRKATAALATVMSTGAHLAWLDTTWPMHRKEDIETVGQIMVDADVEDPAPEHDLFEAGRILVRRSTNHRVRVLSVFQRT